MIALFDSGYGGLTVLKPIMELLPEYDYVYLGDSARVPYGNRTPEMIWKFSEEAVEYLFNRGAKLIIFACNTTSSAALRHIQQKYLNGAQEQNKKVLGVVIPMAEEVVKVSKNNHVGVIGTRATINSRVYEKEIAKESAKRALHLPGSSEAIPVKLYSQASLSSSSSHPKIRVFSKACPLLVPLIEEDYHKKPEAISILKKYLKPLKSCNIDTLVLGCTHYPLMLKEIKKIMGPKVKILLSGEVTAKSLKDYLARHPEIESRLSKSHTRTFLTTDDPAKFKSFTEKHFGMKIKMPEKVELD